MTPGGGFKFGAAAGETSGAAAAGATSGFSFGASKTTTTSTSTPPPAGGGFTFGETSAAKQDSSPSKAGFQAAGVSSAVSSSVGFALGASGSGSGSGSSEQKKAEPPKTTGGFSFGSSSSSTSDAKQSASGANWPAGKSGADDDEEYPEEFCSKLEALNTQLLRWVKNHLEKNPLVLLTPVFKDYERHLAKLEEERQKAAKKTEKEKTTGSSAPQVATVKPVSSAKWECG